MILKSQGDWHAFLEARIALAEAYQKQWMLNISKTSLKEAIVQALPATGEQDTLIADAYYMLGKQHYYLSETDSTLLYWRKTMEIRQDLLDERHPGIAAAYLALGTVNNVIGEYKQAIEYYTKALEAYRRAKSEISLETAKCYNNIGYLYNETDQYRKSLENHFKALEIRQQLTGKNGIENAKSYYNIGEAFHSLGVYDSAMINAQRSLEMREMLYGPMHPEVLGSRMSIGNIYLTQSKPDQALAYYNSCLEIVKVLEEHPSVETASVYYAIGYTYFHKVEYDLAMEYYERALQIYREVLGEDNLSVAGCYNNMGMIHTYLDEYETALDYYNRGFQIFSNIYGDAHTAVAMALNNIGLVHYDRGVYDSALVYLHKALDVNVRAAGETHIQVPAIHNNIGLTTMRMNQPVKAMRHYNIAFSKYEALFGSKNPDIADVYNNMGLLSKLSGDEWNSLKYYQYALHAGIRSAVDTTDYLSVPPVTEYSSWETVLKSLYEKARLLSDFSGEIPGVSNTDLLESALAHYKACDELITMSRRETRSKQDKLLLGEKASAIYQDAVETCKTLSGIFRNADDRVAGNEADTYDEMAFYFSEKNKTAVLLEALAGVEAQKFSGIPDSTLRYEKKLQEQISQYRKLLSEQPGSEREKFLRKHLFDLNRQYDVLIRNLENGYEDYYHLKYNHQPVTLSGLQELLEENEAVISYLKGTENFTIFTITQEELKVTTVPGIENLGDTLRYFRYGLTYTHSSRFSAFYRLYAEKLYRRLLPEMPDSSINRLILIPDAELCLIPFEVLLTQLPVNDDWRTLPYLVRKYAISYSYSATLFHKTFSSVRPGHIEQSDLHDWIAFAPVFDDRNTAGMTLRTRQLISRFDKVEDDIEGTRGSLSDGSYLNPLPSTETEVMKIFSVFNEKEKSAVVQIKSRAHERAIKKGELGNYRMLHFATHGFVNTEDPGLSGIFLARDTTLEEDGVLLSDEIYNLDLRADLTVLSACETGLGKIRKGEGLIGLTRALLYAGSKNIIVSLWKVADESTSRLMIDFYGELLNQEYPVADHTSALRLSKLKMIEQGTYAHPFYWSPFVLIGK